MKKHVPFKKEIEFNSNIDEINSISLEHEITEKKDSLIAGKFILSGDYKMTPASPNLDIFNYELPFNINIDKKYNIDSSNIDISDFYYEVINNKILSVNIELEVDNVIEKSKEELERCVEIENKEEILEEKIKEDEEYSKEEIIQTKVSPLFDYLEDNDTYTTYKIHIITENDTLESIITDYNTTKEKLEGYNNLSEIKLGNKLIIPANDNQ